MTGVGGGVAVVSEVTQTVISGGVWAMQREACFLADSHHFLSCHVMSVSNPR